MLLQSLIYEHHKLPSKFKFQNLSAVSPTPSSIPSLLTCSTLPFSFTIIVAHSSHYHQATTTIPVHSLPLLAALLSGSAARQQNAFLEDTNCQTDDSRQQKGRGVIRTFCMLLARNGNLIQLGRSRGTLLMERKVSAAAQQLLG